MGFVYNDPVRKNLRKTLRNTATVAENTLWQALRRSQFKGRKFWRQYGVGRYVLDFYCPKLRLAIELDGSQHAKPEQIEYDYERSRFLESHDITVIRFWNNDVINSLDSVLQSLNDCVDSLDFHSPLLGQEGIEG